LADDAGERIRLGADIDIQEIVGKAASSCPPRQGRAFTTTRCKHPIDLLMRQET
jgi:hypothetical protein